MNKDTLVNELQALSLEVRDQAFNESDSDESGRGVDWIADVLDRLIAAAAS